jgi:deazaflavin-dependent oxidoreductase (nitroreductase family)
MSNSTSAVSGWRRALFRAPIYLYRWNLGRLVPSRFLYLQHLGRKSGVIREAVLEVVKRDDASDTYYVASGYGAKSNWYRNLQAQPTATVQVGGRRFEAAVDLLDPTSSGQMMVDYAATHPKLAQRLMSLIGFETDGSEDSYRTIGEEHIPFVAFRPA